MDVKHVPAACYKGEIPQKFYQYTMIDEASRERFIYAYEEQSSASTCDFIARAIRFSGYVPQMIQTDNGAEFTHVRKTERIHPMDALCQKLHIEHKCIRLRTPWHNGKVERSHQNDQEPMNGISLVFSGYDPLNLIVWYSYAIGEFTRFHSDLLSRGCLSAILLFEI